MAKDDPNSITKFDGLAIESDPIKGTTDTATGLCPPVVTQAQRDNISNIHKYDSDGNLISIRPGTIVYNLDNALEYYGAGKWVTIGGGIAPGGDVVFNDCTLTGGLIIEGRGATIDNNLIVGKDLTVSGTFESDNKANFENITVNGNTILLAPAELRNTTITGILDVIGNVGVNGSITATGDIKGNNIKAISLELTKAPTFNEAIVNTQLDVNGDIDVAENVTVEGQITGKQSLTITGNSNLNNLNTSGNTTLNTLVVSNGSTLDSLTVNNASTFNDFTVLGTANLNTLNVAGGLVLNNISSTGLAQFNDLDVENLNVNTAAALNTLVVSNGSTLNSLTADDINTNSLTVNNASTLKGNVTANNNLSVLGTTSSQNLSVSGNSNLNNLTTTGTSTLNSLNVSNASTLNSLTVSNASNLNTLSVAGNSNLNNLTTTGTTTLNSLNVSNASTLKDLTVTNTTSLQDLTLNKNPVFVNDLTTNKNITAGSIIATGALISNNTLNVTGATSLQGTLDVSYDANLQGKLNVVGDTTLSNATITNINNKVNLVNATKTSQLTLDTTNNPNLVFKNNNASFSTTVQAATPTQDISITLPNGTPSSGQLLATTGGANPTWYYTNPTSGGNVTGNANTTTNAIALWGNNVGTILNSTDITIDANSNLNLNSHKIVSLADPNFAQDASTKNYVDTTINSKTIALTGAVTGSTNLVTGSIATTLTNIIPSQVIGFDAEVRASRLDQMSIPTSSLNLNSQKLINVLDPLSGQDAATKNYIDTRNITLTGSISGTGSLATGNIATTIANITSSQISDFFSAVNVISNNTLSSNIRTGTIFVGDVAGLPTGNLTVTGAILTAVKTNVPTVSPTGSSITITFANLGYAPILMLQWFDGTQSSVANDIFTTVYRSITNTTAEIYLEESSGSTQSGSLHIAILAPSIGSGVASQGISGVFDTILANALLTAKASIDMSNTNINNLALPTTANQAVNKTYADSLRFIPTFVLLTTTGSFTVPAGVTKLKVTVIGAGGGGASGVANSGSGGGAGGGAAIGVLTVTPNQVIAYTIGAAGTGGVGGGNGGNGGTTTFSTISATGGTGGTIYPGGTNPSVVGVSGGVGSGGDINLRGGRGGAANYITQNSNNAYPASGDGGDGASEYGGKGAKGVVKTSTNGSGGSLTGQSADSNSYGAGGSGACVSATSVTVGTFGGTGASGAIIIEY
jgi:hypothetical protein